MIELKIRLNQVERDYDEAEFKVKKLTEEL